MLPVLFEKFGENLPEKHIFFATEGVPTRALFFREFGTWVNFNNEYKRFIAKQRVVEVAKSTPKPVAASKGTTDAK